MELAIYSVNGRLLPVKTQIMKLNFTIIPGLVLLLAMASCEVANDVLGGNQTVTEIQGEWSVDETSQYFKSTMDVYSVTFSPDPDNPNGIIIDNFYNVGISVKGNVSGGSITIPNQNAQDGYVVHGSGTISNNRQEINMDYIVDDGSGVEDHCTAILTKL
jgi:hypothetical protein